MNNFRKIHNVLFAMFIVAGFLIAESASAEALINSVKLNGTERASIGAGDAVAATVNATLTNPSAWRSTAYNIGDGSWNCVDTPDYEGNMTVSATFPIIAPIKNGTNNVNFEIYENNNCTSGLDMSVASADLSAVVLNIFSSGTGMEWVLLALIVMAIILFMLYIFKRKHQQIK